MWAETSLKKKLGIRYPLIQAPMAGGATAPELVAAVSNAGGLGSLGAGYLSAPALRKAIHAVKELSKQPYGVNLFIPGMHHATDSEIAQAVGAVNGACQDLDIQITPPASPYLPSFEEQMSVILAEKVPVFSFTFGLLGSEWIVELKKNNTIILGTATTLKEAKALDDMPVDGIILQGSEAGGHRGTFIGQAEEALQSREGLLIACLNQVKAYLVATGGLMTGEQCANALRQGADGIQLGTRFLSSHESGIDMSYKSALIEASEDKTVLTRAFSGKLARGLNNTFIDKMAGKPLLDYPIQNALTSEMRRKAREKHNRDYQSLWAGTGVSYCKSESAQSIVDNLVEEIEAYR